MEAKEFEIQILERTESEEEYSPCILDSHNDLSAIEFATALWGGNDFMEIVNRDIVSNLNLN